MNKLIISTFVVFALSVTYAATPYRKLTTIEKDALRNGAKTRIIFKVLDYDGGVVSDALVNVAFEMWPRESNNPKGFTDENGIFIAEDICTFEYAYEVSKTNYYDSYGAKCLTIDGLIDEAVWGNKRINPPYLTNGSWIINNPTNIVILKKIKDPIKMKNFSFSRELKTVVPAMGFDLLKGDFVKPYGKGETVDFVLDFEGYKQSWTNYYYKLTMSFTNGVDGAYIENQYDNYSEMPYVYEADENASYTNKFIFEKVCTGNDSDYVDTTIPEKSYFILRTRSKLNENGEVISINYSRVHGSLSFRHNFFWINGYFNTKTNSISLERKWW